VGEQYTGLREQVPAGVHPLHNGGFRVGAIEMNLISKVGIMSAAIVLLHLSPTGWAQEVLARPSDKDVQKLVKDIEQHQKKFERALDSKFKRSVLRGPAGEIDVDIYLDDLSVAMERLRKRFTGSYSASTEAQEVLSRADFMNAYMRDNPSLKGANEWDVMASSLQQLAFAYGTTFPLPEAPEIRRIGDGELTDAATAIAKFSRDFDKVLSKSTRGMDELKEPVKGGRAELKTMSDAAKTLSSRIRSGKPASAEARQLMDSAQAVQALVDMEGMPVEVATAWEAGALPIRKISQAYGL
jgi:hypothetical protein